MTTVPNWIAKAVILNPRTGTVEPIVEWRATKTQVIVRTDKRGPERRFRLEDLAQLGESRGFPGIAIRLAAPNDPAVVAARRARAADRARGAVMLFVETQRLQDGRQDAGMVADKLIAIRDEVTLALAELEPFL